MIYQVTHEVSENDLPENCTRIIPIYKSFKDDLTDEIDWIHTYKDFIVRASCEYVWDLYCQSFANSKILSKNNFYKLVRQKLSLKVKMVRLSQDSVKYCFCIKG